jgi:hypothetical protein
MLRRVSRLAAFCGQSATVGQCAVLKEVTDFFQTCGKFTSAMPKNFPQLARLAVNYSKIPRLFRLAA